MFTDTPFLSNMTEVFSKCAYSVLLIIEIYDKNYIDSGYAERYTD